MRHSDGHGCAAAAWPGLLFRYHRHRDQVATEVGGQGSHCRSHQPRVLGVCGHFRSGWEEVERTRPRAAAATAPVVRDGHRFLRARRHQHPERVRWCEPCAEWPATTQLQHTARTSDTGGDPLSSAARTIPAARAAAPPRAGDNRSISSSLPLSWLLSTSSSSRNRSVNPSPLAPMLSSRSSTLPLVGDVFAIVQ